MSCFYMDMHYIVPQNDDTNGCTSLNTLLNVMKKYCHHLGAAYIVAIYQLTYSAVENYIHTATSQESYAVFLVEESYNVHTPY